MADCVPATFLILSDIHFGELSYVPEMACPQAPPKNIIRNAVDMIESLVNAVRENPQHPTAILAPGDLTSIAAPAEFDGCVSAVYEIAQKLSIDREKVFFTFGNHDTNWRIAGLTTGTERFAPDNGYAAVAAEVGRLHARNSSCTEAGPIVGSGIFVRDDFVLFVLNSGHSCIAEQEYPHGKLGAQQLSWLESSLPRHINPSKWNLLMVHHHPYKYPFPTVIEDISCIEEGAEVLEVAGRNGIDLICHGHRHHPKLFTEQKSGWKQPITFLCAGSVAVNEHHRMKGEIPNLFHILHLERRLQTGSAFGTLVSYRYRTAEGWLHVSNDAKYTPIDPVQKFGVLSTETEFESQVREIITSAISESGDVSSLPALESLPLALQCCPIAKLNEAFKSDAKARGLKFLGLYPGETFLKR